MKTASALAVVVAAQNLSQLLEWARRTSDTRDPLTQIDIADHAFVELDEHGQPMSGTAPPAA